MNTAQKLREEINKIQTPIATIKVNSELKGYLKSLDDVEKVFLKYQEEWDKVFEKPLESTDKDVPTDILERIKELRG